MTNRNRRTRLTAKTVAAAKPGTREYTADIRRRDPVEAAIELVFAALCGKQDHIGGQFPTRILHKCLRLLLLRSIQSGKE